MFFFEVYWNNNIDKVYKIYGSERPGLRVIVSKEEGQKNAFQKFIESKRQVKDEQERIPVEEAKELALKSFPKHTPRPNQVKAINEAIDLVYKGKKFIIIDGPVGSGKSAINYALLKTFGGGAYITPFKQLQDQLMREEWPTLHNIKGRNAYTCNHAKSLGRPDISCGYDGYDIQMCRNDDTTKTVGDSKELENIIKGVIKKYGFNPVELEKVSGFSDKLIKERPDIFKEILSGDNDLYAEIGCSHSECECPIKSHRAILRNSNVKVMNPDVMLLLGKVYDEVRNHEILVYDEAHKITDVIHRIFTVDVPYKEFTEKLGVDVFHGSIHPELATELYKVTSRMAEAAMYKLFTAKDQGSLLMNLLSGDAKLAGTLNGKMPREYIEDHLNGSPNMFSKAFFDGVEPIHRKEISKMLHHVEMDNLPHINEVFESMSKTIFNYSDKGDYIVSHNKAKYEELRLNYLSGKRGDLVDCIRFTPYNIGKLMNKFFYSSSKIIVLSTGTWIGWESTLREIGVLYGDDSREKIGAVKIESTFDKAKRPIKAADKTFDMSRKDQNGKYLYESNCKKFAEITAGNIDEAMTHGNVLVHCNSFKIVKLLAENLPNYVPGKFVFHLNDNSPLRNGPTKQFIKPFTKEAALNQSLGKGVVIFSPSLTEGVDFKGDRARAQIIVKSPIPYMGDPYVKKRLSNDPTFLDRIIWMNVIQMYGRVMRSDDDSGLTIIQDVKLIDLIKKSKDPEFIKKFNLKYFMEGLV